ncbi:hypothetical protein [Kitasatospora sp. NPDC059827]|uniref:hypothetical protein n=1 Tax=Kitasatospora sp. NPDC059827 TaxID=3346964 RepID=UPI003657AC5F
MTSGSPGRWLLRGFLTLCVLITVGCAWWAVATVLRLGHPAETDGDRAERVAGLDHEQHPHKGRYYIPTDTALSRIADGSQVAYLHYRLGGGEDVNIDDFLRTYDLPLPGTRARLPEDLKAALPGEEPAEGVLLPEGRPGRQVFVVEQPGGRPGAADVYVRAAGS